MDQVRSTLLPNLISYLKKYNGVHSVSQAQLILRANTDSLRILTDGFFFIETTSREKTEKNSFIRVKHWKIELFENDLKLHLIDWEYLGVETMSDYQVKPVKSELQIKALMVSAFRVQLRDLIPETPISLIFSTIASLQSLSP